MNEAFAKAIASAINSAEVSKSFMSKYDTASAEYWLWKRAYCEAVIQLIDLGIPHVLRETIRQEYDLCTAMCESYRRNAA